CSVHAPLTPHEVLSHQTCLPFVPSGTSARVIPPACGEASIVKIQSRRQLASVTGIALVGALALSGCGSDNNATASSGPGGSTTGTTPQDKTDCPTGTLNAEGSSAQKNAIEEAIRTFQEKCLGATVNYSATGSGAGIKQFTAGQVDFGGSDSPLKTTEKDGKIEATEAEKTCGSPAWNLPMVTGPV